VSSLNDVLRICCIHGLHTVGQGGPPETSARRPKLLPRANQHTIRSDARAGERPARQCRCLTDKQFVMLSKSCCSVQAWNFLGLCQVSMGDIRPGASCYERVLRVDPNSLEAWMHLAQARKEVRMPVCYFLSELPSLSPCFQKQCIDPIGKAHDCICWQVLLRPMSACDAWNP
jgi:hypothetical protein